MGLLFKQGSFANTTTKLAAAAKLCKDIAWTDEQVLEGVCVAHMSASAWRNKEENSTGLDFVRIAFRGSGGTAN
jgi:hypothetical protein